MGDGAIAELDYAFLGQAARVDFLAAIRAQRARLDAQETVLLAGMAADPDPYRDGTPEVLGKEWVREDVACALRVPSPTAAMMLHTATRVVTRFPDTLAAMAARQVSIRYAQRLVDATDGLSDAVAAAVEAKVLAKAPLQTVAQFAVSVRRAVLTVDPRTAEERHASSRADRRVEFTAIEDGMTLVKALLPAEDAAHLQSAVDATADQLKERDRAAGFDRTADQRRADALTCLAFGAGNDSGPGAEGGVAAKPAVNVTIALSTLLDLDQQPGELDGHGPIPAALARAIAFDPTGTWRRLVTDPAGNLLDVSSRTYRPPAAMTRFVELRDVTCCAPGCRRQAVRCELDHTIDWANGGPTCPANLMALCARHHHLKHDAGWRLTRLDNGAVRWTTPTGHVHDRPPPDPLPQDTTMVNAAANNPDDPPPF